MTLGLLEIWHIVEIEDGAEVPNHVGETHLKYMLIRSWSLG